MDQVQLEPGPDGAEWWPEAFGAHGPWVDDRGTSWRAVTNYPNLQARRVDDRLHLRELGGETHTYSLTESGNYYVAIKENDNG